MLLARLMHGSIERLLSTSQLFFASNSITASRQITNILQLSLYSL